MKNETIIHLHETNGNTVFYFKALYRTNNWVLMKREELIEQWLDYCIAHITCKRKTSSHVFYKDTENNPLSCTFFDNLVPVNCYSCGGSIEDRVLFFAKMLVLKL